MPYINKDKRVLLNGPLDVAFSHCETKGDINYCITRLVHLWVIELITRAKKRSYNLLSLGHNVLCDAAAEYYRKVMSPYEDKAIGKNGPVSKLDGDLDQIVWPSV